MITDERLQVPGQITEISLNLPANLSENEWIKVGEQLVPLVHSTQWWVGDWILYGERLYGKRRAYDLAHDATGYARDTLYQYARVAERIEAGRRVRGLSFSVHRAVECLPPADQDLFLAEAQLNGYGEEKLRELIEQVPAPESASENGEPEKPVRSRTGLDADGRYQRLKKYVLKLYRLEAATPETVGRSQEALDALRRLLNEGL